MIKKETPGANNDTYLPSLFIAKSGVENRAKGKEKKSDLFSINEYKRANLPLSFEFSRGPSSTHSLLLIVCPFGFPGIPRKPRARIVAQKSIIIAVAICFLFLFKELKKG